MQGLDHSCVHVAVCLFVCSFLLLLALLVSFLLLLVVLSLPTYLLHKAVNEKMKKLAQIHQLQEPIPGEVLLSESVDY